jgi:hypothetical protein
MHMKTLYASLMVAGLLVVTGCNVSSTGGKPGESGGAFTLKGPMNTPETSVKQGESVSKDLSVEAEKNFKESIAFAVTVEPGDKGVTASVEPSTWKASDNKKVGATRRLLNFLSLASGVGKPGCGGRLMTEPLVYVQVASDNGLWVLCCVPPGLPLGWTHGHPCLGSQNVRPTGGC